MSIIYQHSQKVFKMTLKITEIHVNEQLSLEFQHNPLFCLYNKPFILSFIIGKYNDVYMKCTHVYEGKTFTQHFVFETELG